MRGTFANIRLRNEMAPGTEGGWTTTAPGGTPVSIYDAAMEYQKQGTPLVIIAGKEYGTGSSRDWAAKGTRAARRARGDRRVASSASTARTSSAWACCRSSSRTARRGSRSASPASRRSTSTASTTTLEAARDADGDGDRAATAATKSFKVLCRIDTPEEMNYYKNGGILPYVLRSLARK